MFRYKKCSHCNGSGQDIDDEATGRNVKEMRQSYNCGLRELSRAVGWSATYLSDLEKGKRKWTEPKMERYMTAMRAIRTID